MGRPIRRCCHAKRQEKAQRSTADAIDAVAKTLPALWRAEKMESKAAKALKAASEKLPARKEKAALPEKGTEQTETTEPAEAADSTKLAAESETEADAARETANV